MSNKGIEKQLSENNWNLLKAMQQDNMEQFCEYMEQGRSIRDGMQVIQWYDESYFFIVRSKEGSQVGAVLPCLPENTSDLSIVIHNSDPVESIEPREIIQRSKKENFTWYRTDVRIVFKNIQ
jgi:hypothetical protein